MDSSLIAVLTISIIGIVSIALVMKRKPQWKMPMVWMGVGALLFQLLRYSAEFLV